MSDRPTDWLGHLHPKGDRHARRTRFASLMYTLPLPSIAISLCSLNGLLVGPNHSAREAGRRPPWRGRGLVPALEGRLTTFHVGDQVLEAAPGTFVFGPRNAPRRFSVDVEPTKVLVISSPGGGFFGSPRDAETGLFEAGSEFRLLSYPSARKSSVNLLTEPA